MPTSITIPSGKFAVYINEGKNGASPYKIVLNPTDGAACVLQDSRGYTWIFRIFNGSIRYKRSGDKTTTFCAWTVITTSTENSAKVVDGVPSVLELETGRIEIKYWKTLTVPPATSSTEKWYRVYTDDVGADPIVWTEEEVTTA